MIEAVGFRRVYLREYVLAVNHLFALAVKQNNSKRPQLQVKKGAAAAKIKVVVKRGKDPTKDQVVDMGSQVVSRGLLLPAINTKEVPRVPGASISGQENVLEETELLLLEEFG
jgi:hypothetical protein